MYTHLLFSFSRSAQYVQGLIFYSNQFHYWVDILTFLFIVVDLQSTSLKENKKKKDSFLFCFTRDKENLFMHNINRSLVNALILFFLSSRLFYPLVHDKEQLSQYFVHNVCWEKRQNSRSEWEKDNTSKGHKTVQLTNESDSSLLFCFEEQSSWLSRDNYLRQIVHALFLLTRIRNYKSFSFRWQYVSFTYFLSFIIPPTNRLQL